MLPDGEHVELYFANGSIITLPISVISVHEDKNQQFDGTRKFSIDKSNLDGFANSPDKVPKVVPNVFVVDLSKTQSVDPEALFALSKKQVKRIV